MKFATKSSLILARGLRASVGSPRASGFRSGALSRLGATKIRGLSIGVGHLIVALGVGSSVIANTSYAQTPVAQLPSPEIWFGPLQAARSPNGPGVVFSKYDFPRMLESDDGWRKALQNISVLELDIVHISEHFPDIPAVVQWTTHQSLRISGGGSLVNTGTAVPGGGSACSHPASEGLSEDRRDDVEVETTHQIHKWKMLGGRLDYLTMDSPFFFGYYGAEKYCGYSIEQVAVRTAMSVNKIIDDYPNIQIVDDEGPGPIAMDRFLSDYGRFIEAFNAVSHIPITRIMMDMHWTDAWHQGYNWLDATRAFITFAHKRNIKIGLLINADDGVVSSDDGRSVTTTPVTADSWVRMARGHMALAHENQLALDAVEIVSWMRFPTHNLPETDSTALSSLVNDAATLWPQR